MSLRNVTEDQREALRIVEAFTQAIAYPALYPQAAILAAEHIESDRFNTADDANEIVTAFAKYLREQALQSS